MPSSDASPSRRRLLVAAAAVAALAVVALVVLLVVKALNSEDAEEVTADADGYVDLGCSLAAELAAVPSDEVADGADGSHTADLHAAAALFAAAGRLDEELSGFTTLAERLDLFATRQEADGIATQLEAADSECGDRGDVEVTDELRTSYACAIGARLREEVGDVEEAASPAAAPLWELRAMRLLTDGIDEASYGTTAEPAQRALTMAGQADDEEYDAALADLGKACADAGL
jgi:hypothetical protein